MIFFCDDTLIVLQTSCRLPLSLLVQEIHTILSIVVELNVIQATSHVASERHGDSSWRSCCMPCSKMASTFEVIQDLPLKASV